MNTAFDFDDTRMLLIFPGSSQITQRCATFNIVDDDIGEPTEQFTVTASRAMFVGGQDIATVQIQDNDGKAIEKLMP